jgi:Flp pilus assembly pilin Flp
MARKCHTRPLVGHWVPGPETILFRISGGTLYSTLIWGVPPHWERNVISTIRQLWVEEDGQDVAEYAVMLAVILVIVIGTVRLIGGNANNVFSQVGSSIQQ